MKSTGGFNSLRQQIVSVFGLAVYFGRRVAVDSSWQRMLGWLVGRMDLLDWAD